MHLNEIFEALDRDGIRTLPETFIQPLADRNKWEEITTHMFYATYRNQLSVQAARYRSEAIPSLLYSRYKQYDSTGKRLDYELAYFSHRGRMSTFALLALMGDDSAISDLEDAIWAVCDEFTWCLPAHLGEQSLNPDGINGIDPASVPPSFGHLAYLRAHASNIDLFAAETAFTLAEITALLEARLSPIVKARARNLVMERVLASFTSIGPKWSWETSTNNWSAVCAGAVGIAAMYLISDSHVLAPLIQRLLGAMDAFLSGFEADGACTEGLAYWNFGYGFFVAFAERLFALTNGKLDLLQGEKIRQISLFQQRCWLDGDAVISFSDAARIETWHAGLTCFLMHRFPDVRIPDTSHRQSFDNDYTRRWSMDLRDLVWSEPRLVEQEPIPKEAYVWDDRQATEEIINRNDQSATDVISTYSPERINDSLWMENACWLIAKRGTRGNVMAFAAKGGHNDEPHNHNDVGTFLLRASGETFLTDTGSGEYTREYFGPERYSYLCNRSAGHSVPMIDGQEQHDGRKFGATVLEVETTLERDMLRLELTRAYAVPTLIQLARSFVWVKEPVPHLLLTDAFKFSKIGVPLVERFVSFLKPEIHDGFITIRGTMSTLMIASKSEGFLPEINSGVYVNHTGVSETLWMADFIGCYHDASCSFQASFRFMAN